MNPRAFGPGIAASQARLAELAHYKGSGEAGLHLDEAVAELSTTLEELRVADEELRRQNDELELARAEAEAMANRYLELFDLLPAGYVITDREGRVLELNRHAAEMLGRPGESLVGEHLSACIHRGHAKLFGERLAETLASGQRRDWESWLLPPKGSSFLVVDLTAVPGTNEKGEGIVRWLIQDRTAQRRAEGEAKRLDDAMWLRVADRTAVLTGERESMRDEIGRLRQRIQELERARLSERKRE